MHPIRRLSSGFTLIEIAVVLFIGGILLAGAIQLTTSLIENAKQKATRENMQAIKLALQNYVGRTGRLPCPALHTDVETSATFGLEAPTPGTCTGTVNLGAGLAKFGTLPWKTLGLSAASAMDGWNNQFSYAVTLAATSSNLTNIGAIRGALTVHTEAPVAPGLPIGGNQINACSVTPGDNSCNLLSSVVIISHGSNGLGAYTRVGTAAALPTSNREIENAIFNATTSAVKTNVAFISSDYSEVIATYFDDTVMSLAPADVLSSLYAQGAIKTENAVLNATVETIKNNIIAVAYNSGGIDSGERQYVFPASLPSMPAAQLIDPWGRAIQYIRTTQNVKCSIPLLNTDIVFTLTSYGPDATTPADDQTFTTYVSDIKAMIVKGGCNS